MPQLVKFLFTSFGLLSLSGCFALQEPGAFLPSKITFCTQNLRMLYRVSTRYGPNEYFRQKTKLMEERFRSNIQSARCDIVALQEVVGENTNAAQQNAQQLARNVSSDQLKYRAYVGETNHRFIRNGFLVREGLFSSVTLVSYNHHLLPKRTLLGYERYFRRGPLKLVGRLSNPSSYSLSSIVAFSAHFVSRSSPEQDPTGTEWEARRIEQAEALHSLLRVETEKSSFDNSLVILGIDRNSTEASQSAGSLLSGATENAAGQTFTALLASDRHKSGIPHYTHEFQGDRKLLDDILIPSDQAWRVRKVWTEGQSDRIADHLLVAAEIILDKNKP